MPDKNRIARWLDAPISVVDAVADDINADVDHATYGLAALKALLDTLDTVADGIQSDLDNETDGLGALKALIDTVDSVVDSNYAELTDGVHGLAAIATLIETVDTVVDGIQADLDNETDGLGALKALIDTVDTIVDAIQANTDNLPADPASQSSVETAISNAESAIRGVDGDDLKTLSDQIDAVQSSVEGIQNNTRFTAAVPVYMQRPSAGDESYRVASNLYDTAGTMEDPANSEILVRVLQDGGTPITDKLFKENALTNALDNPTDDTNFPAASGWRAMEREAAGKYFLFYSVASDATEESLTVEFGWDEGGNIVYQSRATLISDATNDLNAILSDTADMQPKLGTPVTTISGDIAVVDGNVDTIKNEVQDGTYGLNALKSLIDTVDTVVDGIQSDLDNATDGLSALKSAIDGNYSELADVTHGLGALKSLIDTVDTVVDGIQSDLDNPTDGLSALKSLIDTVDAVVDGIQADLDNETDGLGALKALIDTVDSVVDSNYAELTDASHGLAALKTAIDNVDSGNTELVGGTSTATHNVEVADGTSEVSVATFSPSKNGEFAVQFDVSALETAGEGGTVTIRLKSKLDGTNLRTLDKSSYIVGTDEMMPAVKDTVFKGTDVVEATIQCSSAVTLQRAVPYRVIEFA